MTRISHSTMTTPGGERLVVMTQEAFDDLSEAVDKADAEMTRGSIARGEQELLTKDEVKAALAAPTPLAFWRQKRGLTQQALAEAAGISQQYLSGLEGGKRKGDPALFKRLARALRTRIDDLVEDEI